MEALRDFDFMEEAPTLECIPSGCKMCMASMKCHVPEAEEGEPLPPPPNESAGEWDGDTEPSVIPGFMKGYDDDFILDSELGGSE